MKYVGRGAVRVPSTYARISALGSEAAGVASAPSSPSPAAAAADPKKRPTQKSAANGPADDALTASTRLYRDARLPRTSPAIRILTAFGSDIASGLSGARELWRRARGNHRNLQQFIAEGWFRVFVFPKLSNTK